MWGELWNGDGRVFEMHIHSVLDAGSQRTMGNRDHLKSAYATRY